MRATFLLATLTLLTACANAPESTAEQGALGKVRERKIVSTTMERSVSRPQVPIRERAMSSQPFQESVLKPVYEHLIVLEDGRSLRVQSTHAGYPVGTCVRVVEGDNPARLLASTGCK
ncbi:hypothetical protein [Piscinibacter gummiphilus]|uniref:Uncharacterized protein n=1 Tax=Piscinibacter gummiphilus TaxID=946333 RepID=A0ABZ0CSB1_9BURK|nr:hypothetical protein [Piscinibacter gummiphilus]WOB07878.1 hypothetical protein RXV79_23595 [Piscinibacter gummiphilus]